MRHVLVVALLVVAACCKKPAPCPTLPVRPVSPEPVVVVAPKTPCNVPPKPAAWKLVGMATAEGVLVSKSDLAGLVEHLALLSARQDALEACVGAR